MGWDNWLPGNSLIMVIRFSSMREIPGELNMQEARYPEQQNLAVNSLAPYILTCLIDLIDAEANL